MGIVGNIIWLVFGGIFTAIGYFISSVPLFISIIGIPFGWQVFRLGLFALWPFGSQIVSKPNNSGCLLTIMNIIWFFIGGLWLSLLHLLFGLLLCLTIIGIPFGLQHFKLASFALTPFGREIIAK